jgi:hypothetical protein
MCRIDHGRVVCCEDVGSADHFDGENSFPISSPRHVSVRAFVCACPKKGVNLKMMTCMHMMTHGHVHACVCCNCDVNPSSLARNCGRRPPPSLPPHLSTRGLAVAASFFVRECDRCFVLLAVVKHNRTRTLCRSECMDACVQNVSHHATQGQKDSLTAYWPSGCPL